MAQIGQTGRNMKMAFAKFGTNSWGVAASVTKGVYFESDGGLQYQVNQVTDNAFSQNFLGPSDPGLVEPPNLTYTGYTRYNDYQYILEGLAMGSPTAVAISTSAAGQTTSYSHIFNLADSIDGLGATIAIDKNLFVDELTSAKVFGFELMNSDNGGMKTTFKVIGSKPTNISSVNINSTLAGATYPPLSDPRVTQQQGVFRMNLNSAGALGAGDTIRAESIKFTFERAQDAPHVFGQDFVDEPADNAQPVCSIEVTYPRMNTPNATSLYSGLRSQVAFKADWTFTGPFINSTDTYKVLYEFPYLQLETWDGSVPDAASQVKPKAKWRAALAPTSPTGMAFVRPFRMSRIMTQSVVAF